MANKRSSTRKSSRKSVNTTSSGISKKKFIAGSVISAGIGAGLGYHVAKHKYQPPPAEPGYFDQTYNNIRKNIIQWAVDRFV